MSVYIKGMEMPTSCDKCVYSAWSNFYQIYVCDAVRKNDPVLFDGKQTKSTAVARSARADNCPLVPVPPHGRLIDADALRQSIKESIDECHKWADEVEDGEMYARVSQSLGTFVECSLRVKAAPTVIPADPAEEVET